MSILSDELIQILEDADTLKCIATTDHEGIPHVTFKNSLHAENDTIVFYDLLQSSQTNKNLVDAIWFHKKAAVNVLSPDHISYHIICHPQRAVTAGRQFEQLYRKLRSKFGDIDLNAIWYLIPDEIHETTYRARKKEEEEKYPILKHIDRLVKPEYLKNDK